MEDLDTVNLSDGDQTNPRRNASTTSRSNGIKWSPKEQDILRKFYPNPNVTIEDIKKVLSQRSHDGIMHEAHRLGLHRPLGTNIDMKALKEMEKLIEG